MTEHTSRLNEPEAVAVFMDVESMERAVDELRLAGFARDEISLLANEESVKKKLGHAVDDARTLEDEPDAPRAAFVSEEALGAAEGALIGAPAYLGAVATLGALVPAAGIATAIAAALVVGGTGAALGAVLAERVGKRHADDYAKEIENGGLLLWVRLRDEDRKNKALAILGRCSGRDVHVHGWTTPG